HANNLYLETLAGLGLAGIGALLLLAAGVAGAARTAIRHHGATSVAGLFAGGAATGLAAYPVHGFFDYFLEFPPRYGLVWLLAVFLPTWMSAADRLGIHRLHTITGEKLEIIRRVILTQAWGVASIGLILTFAQVSLNRSLILVFLTVSTTMLLVLKAAQAPWLARRRGQSRVLLIGDASTEMAGEFERLRGRHVERWTGHDPEALDTRFRAGGV